MSVGPEELRRAEQRVARSRRELRGEFDGWVRHKRDSVASFRGLAAVIGAGFVIGGLLRRRRPAPGTAVAPVAGAGLLSVIAGLAMAALRTRYANPWAAVPELLMRRRLARRTVVPPSRPAAAAKPAAPPGPFAPTAPGPDSRLPGR